MGIGIKSTFKDLGMVEIQVNTDPRAALSISSGRGAGEFDM